MNRKTQKTKRLWLALFGREDDPHYFVDVEDIDRADVAIKDALKGIDEDSVRIVTVTARWSRGKIASIWVPAGSGKWTKFVSEKKKE